MVIRKIEPDEQDKMQDGYEYLKIISTDGQSTLIYYDKASQREESVEGNYGLKLMLALRDGGWEHVYSDLEHYFERLTPEGEQHKKEAEEKAHQAEKEAHNPPDDLRQFVSPLDTKKMNPKADYVYVEWFRDNGRANITYFNSDKSHTEHRSVKIYGDLEREFIRKGYYVLGSGGGREGVVGRYVKYRKTPKTLEP